MADHRTASDHHDEHQRFWQKPFVRSGLPFLTSLTVHLGVVIIGIALVKTIPDLLKPTREVNIDPEGARLPEFHPQANLFDRAHGDGKTPGDPADGPTDVPVVQPVTLTQTATQLSKVIENESGASTEIMVGPKPPKSYIAGTDGDQPSGPRMQIGPSSNSIFHRPGSKGPGGPGGPGVGTGSESDGYPPRSVVYVCDASGSMMDKFDRLRGQLNVSISELSPAQSYSVIFFQESNSQHAENLIAMNNELLRATPETRKRTATFLDNVTPRGGTDPVPALKAALALHPDVIWFLVDPEDFPDKPGVLQLVHELNAGHQTKINTIAFFDRSEGDEAFLQQLAKENGGFYKLVQKQDLDR